MYRFVYNTLGGVECRQVQLIWTDGLCRVLVLLQGQCCAGLRRGSPSSLPAPCRLLSFQAGPGLPQPSGPELCSHCRPLSWAGARRLQNSWRPVPNHSAPASAGASSSTSPALLGTGLRGAGLKGRLALAQGGQEPRRSRPSVQEQQREAEPPAPALPSPGMADAGASGLPELCRRGQELAALVLPLLSAPRQSCQHPNRAAESVRAWLHRDHVGIARSSRATRPSACLQPLASPHFSLASPSFSLSCQIGRAHV